KAESPQLLCGQSLLQMKGLCCSGVECAGAVPKPQERGLSCARQCQQEAKL
ncbi:hypothetical protein KIL84_000295, partial [Mauremys mutica]